MQVSPCWVHNARHKPKRTLHSKGRSAMTCRTRSWRTGSGWSEARIPEGIRWLQTPEHVRQRRSARTPSTAAQGPPRNGKAGCRAQSRCGRWKLAPRGSRSRCPRAGCGSQRLFAALAGAPRSMHEPSAAAAHANNQPSRQIDAPTHRLPRNPIAPPPRGSGLGRDAFPHAVSLPPHASGGGRACAHGPVPPRQQPARCKAPRIP